MRPPGDRPADSGPSVSVSWSRPQVQPQFECYWDRRSSKYLSVENWAVPRPMPARAPNCCRLTSPGSPATAPACPPRPTARPEPPSGESQSTAPRPKAPSGAGSLLLRWRHGQSPGPMPRSAASETPIAAIAPTHTPTTAPLDEVRPERSASRAPTPAPMASITADTGRQPM